MKNLHELDKYREKQPFWLQTDKAGAFRVFVNKRSFIVLAGVENIDGEKWEHVSVTPRNQKRCPTWEEMSAIKDMFFESEEEVVEYHPKSSQYANLHEFCLHLWKPVDGSLLRSPLNCMDTLAERDAKLEKMWAELEDVPVDPNTEKLDEPFNHFPVGTDKKDIWNWFDLRHSKGIAFLLSEREMLRK